MISVAETLSSICANLQFREVSEHHGGVPEVNAWISQTQILHTETKNKTSGTAGASRITPITALLHSPYTHCRVAGFVCSYNATAQ